MRKYCKYCKKYRQRNVRIIHNHFCETLDEKDEQSKTTAIEKKNKLGFWKSIWLIIRNKEHKNGNATAFVLAEVMAWFFNAVALCCISLFFLISYAVLFRLDWKINCGAFITQAFVASIVLGATLVVSFIFRAIANDIKAEKDRNYITTLFFGFASLASLIVALIALLKGVA